MVGHQSRAAIDDVAGALNHPLAMEPLVEPGSKPKPSLEQVASWIAPVTLLGYLLYYFGYIRTRALYAVFGISLSQLEMSNTEIVIRATAVLAHDPFRTCLVATLLLVLAWHRWWRGTHWDTSPCYLIVGLVLCAPSGARAFGWTSLQSLPEFGFTVGWVTGVLLLGLSYSRRISTQGRVTPLTARLLYFAVLAQGSFWAVTDIAWAAGQDRGERIAKGLEELPPIRVLSPPIAMPEELHLLTYAAGKYFLLHSFDPTAVFVLPHSDSLVIEQRGE